MTRLRVEQIHHAVTSTYNGLACCERNLSCGAALDLAGPVAGECVVDLGCGRGRDVIRAAFMVGSAGRSIGVDIATEMLTQARAQVPAALGNTHFLCCALEELALPSGCADVVISNCTINHAPDKAAVYGEIGRILKHGGRVVVSDVVAQEEIPAHVRNDAAAWAACYGGAVTEEHYLQIIRDAGLSGLEILQRSQPYSKGPVVVRSLTVRAWRAAVMAPV